MKQLPHFPILSIILGRWSKPLLWLALGCVTHGLPAASPQQAPPHLVLILGESPLDGTSSATAASPGEPVVAQPAAPPGTVWFTSAFRCGLSPMDERTAILTGWHPARLAARKQGDRPSPASAVAGGVDRPSLERLLRRQGYRIAEITCQAGDEMQPASASARKMAPLLDGPGSPPFLLIMDIASPSAERCRTIVRAVNDQLRAHHQEENTLLIAVGPPELTPLRHPSHPRPSAPPAARSDEALRVSLLLQWPGRWGPSRSIAPLTSVLDIFPTVLAAAGATLDNPRASDGVSLLSLADGKINRAPHSMLAWEWKEGAAIRQGDQFLVQAAEKGSKWRTRPAPSLPSLHLSSACSPTNMPALSAALRQWQARPDPHPSERWAPDLRGFVEADRTNAPLRGGVLFVGSSTIRLWTTLEQDFAEHQVLNRGFGGSEMLDSIYWFDRLIAPHRPRSIVIYAGDNDLANGLWPEQVCADFQALVRKIQARQPGAGIFYLAIKPSRSRLALLEDARRANALIQAVCQPERGVTFVDTFTPTLGLDGKPRTELFATDQLHLNAGGYAVWREVLRPYLRPEAPAAP